MIPIENIKNNIRGVIHIGAYHAEERFIYTPLPVIWFEAIYRNYEIASSNLRDFGNNQIFNVAVSDKTGTTFIHTSENRPDCSSFFGGQRTRKYHETIDLDCPITIHTDCITLSDFYKKENIDADKYNFLNVDAEGAELLILKGAADLLHTFDYIYLEVAEYEKFVGAPLFKDITLFLSKYNFSMTEYKEAGDKVGWGDCLYKRIRGINNICLD